MIRGSIGVSVSLLFLVTVFLPKTIFAQVESTSTCWIAYLDVVAVQLESTFPSTVAALDAATEATMSQMRGQPCLIARPPAGDPVDGVITSFVSGDRVSNATPKVNGVGGIPVAYERFIAFQNGSGTFCRLHRFTSQTSRTVAAYDGESRSDLIPLCKGRLVIKLTTLAAPQESGRVITMVEPGKASTAMVARVFEQNGQLVPNVNIKLKADVEPKSGGHGHHDDTRRKGSLRSAQMAGTEISGSTGTDGMVFTFNAPTPAGDHTIAANCTDENRTCTQEGADTVWVGVKELSSLPDSTVYKLIKPNADTFHPDNHYLTATAAQRVTVLAALYHGKFPDDPVLHLNDASLERGGVFDLKRDWAPPHFEHCRGTEFDVRANDAPEAMPSTPRRIKEFEDLAMIVGVEALFHIPRDKDHKLRRDLRHFHVRLMGGKPQCP